MTAESHLYKLLWTALILLTFSFGCDNISQAVADFYKYDKITNIERVFPENVTFPAITICSYEGYWRDRYKNGSKIEEERVFTHLFKYFLIIEKTDFYSFNNDSNHDVKNHLDFFKFHVKDNSYDCLRFNAITNKSIELFIASSTKDEFRIFFKKSFREVISKSEYYYYSFFHQYFYVYIGENSLNSFEKLQHAQLNINLFQKIEIEKVSIETKLPEPYNPCKKSSVDKPYHQWNCIEACTYKEIKNKCNCTFHSTLFSIRGFRQCELNYKVLRDEFSASCLKECPMESCFSEKFTQQVATELQIFAPDRFIFSFRDLSTLNITQIPKTDGFTFLNNIGGGLGLFMGIAFPNLIEFLQYIFEIFLILFI